MKIKLLLIVLLLILVFISCGKKEAAKSGKTDEPMTKKTPFIKDFASIPIIKEQIGKLVPVEIKADLSILSENEKEVLQLIIKAAEYMDKIFLEQVYHNNKQIQRELCFNHITDYQVLHEYFEINFGPFDRLNRNIPFINLVQSKPAGANFYPQDMSKEEFLSWIKSHPESENDFKSNFTLIRRDRHKLVAIPYSEAYLCDLEHSGHLLKRAADLCQNHSLKKYLNSRAEAFSSNDYYQSDIDWVDLKDHKIEVVIGPYEVYEDELFGYKAAFEAFVTIVDPEESKKLEIVAGYLEEMESNLPIEEKYKNFNRGKSSPIMVVNEVYTAGDTKAGVQTTAFNLPNDERVREEKGSKKVMLKNIARAKFDNCWIPIVKEVLVKSQLPFVSFDAYFNHVLLHEVAHGLGPGIITKEGKKTTVNNELKELYSTIEEAKADILGIWNFIYLIDKGIFAKEFEKKMFVSYLGGIFRSIRFGINAAHGGANAIQINYILEKGGFIFDHEKGRFRVEFSKIKDALKQLAHDILMIEALGDYQGAKKLITKYRKITPQVKKALASVADVPIDIRPVYTILNKK